METATNSETETKTSEKLPLELVKKVQEYFDPVRLINLLADVLHNEKDMINAKKRLEDLHKYKEEKRRLGYTDPKPEDFGILAYLVKYL